LSTFQFGTTTTQLPIMGYKFGRSGPETLILGGVHGDEPEGVIASMGLIKRFLESFPLQIQLTIVPQFNLDGVMSKTRCNARGVDLNRNLPTKDWTKEYSVERYYPGTEPNSESENQSLVKWIQLNKPRIIYSLHSWQPMVNVNGNCRPEAEAISRVTGYIVKDDIGYPTPGSLGTYAGLERDIPTVTYEIERGLQHAAILKTHVPAMLEALKVTADRR
jgi:murein peptide amidase A